MYIFIFILCGLGFAGVIVVNNAFKKLVFLNIIQSAVIIFFIALGFVFKSSVPILTQNNTVFSDPLPSVLMLTAIVVGLSVTAVGYALCIRIKKQFGTLDLHKISCIDNKD